MLSLFLALTFLFSEIWGIARGMIRVEKVDFVMEHYCPKSDIQFKL